MQQHETNSKFIKHMACDSCSSSDANSLYDDGHTYCFSCHTTVGANQDMQDRTSQFQSIESLIQITYFQSHSIDDRKITQDTCKKYNVMVAKVWLHDH
jgi:twinkle protein